MFTYVQRDNPHPLTPHALHGDAADTCRPPCLGNGNRWDAQSLHKHASRWQHGVPIQEVLASIAYSLSSGAGDSIVSLTYAPLGGKAASISICMILVVTATGSLQWLRTDRYLLYPGHASRWQHGPDLPVVGFLITSTTLPASTILTRPCWVERDTFSYLCALSEWTRAKGTQTADCRGGDLSNLRECRYTSWWGKCKGSYRLPVSKTLFTLRHGVSDGQVPCLGDVQSSTYAQRKAITTGASSSVPMDTLLTTIVFPAWHPHPNGSAIYRCTWRSPSQLTAFCSGA